MSDYQGLGGGGIGELLTHGDRVSVWDDEKVQEMVVVVTQQCEHTYCRFCFPKYIPFELPRPLFLETKNRRGSSGELAHILFPFARGGPRFPQGAPPTWAQDWPRVTVPLHPSAHLELAC